MEYEHSVKPVSYFGNAFKIGIALNIIFVIVEVIYGSISNSMALMSDAGHNFSDILVLVFSWIAILSVTKKARSEIYLWIPAVNNSGCAAEHFDPYCSCYTHIDWRQSGD